MRRWAVSAGWLVMFVSGCALLGPEGRDGPDSATWEYRRELSRQARQAGAVRDFERVLTLLAELAELDTRSPDAPSRMGRVYERLGRIEEAGLAFERALQRDPNAVDALIGLGRVEMARGRPREAITRFDEAIEIDPAQPPAHVARGQALELLGQTDEALASYFRALKHEPDSPQALIGVATIQLSRDQPESALARLDHLVELDAENPEIRSDRGRARLAIGLIEEAIEDLRFAFEQLDHRADVAYLLALAFEQADDRPAARKAIDRAVALDPNSVAVRELADRLYR